MCHIAVAIAIITMILYSLQSNLSILDTLGLKNCPDYGGVLMSDNSRFDCITKVAN